MLETWVWWVIGIMVVAIAAVLYWRRGARPVPESLRRGQPPPEFTADDEDGNPVNSGQLKGTAVVMIFVRGNWCPFCSRQVSNLTQHYRDIIDLGGRLVLITPKPLETTRRVADFFKVEFDFWLDEDLAVTRQLGLLQEGGVPKDYEGEYGRDTTWPTALVIDAAGIIRYTELSRHISDRPDPRVLLKEIRKTLKT